MSKFNTLTVHAGQDPDAQTGAVIPPLHLSSTFKQDGVGNLRGGFEYSRSGNPTRANLETNLAALEGGTHAFAFASGLAAEDTLLRSILQPGDHVVVANDVYGGTYRLINGVYSKWGVTHTAIDMSDPLVARSVISSTRPKVVWIETPSNPMLKIIDIAAMVDSAHAFGAIVVVDNTFATPALQQPFAFGADAIVHSTTKYLGGHSDVVGGAVILPNDTLAENVGFLHNAAGAIASPFDSYLTVRGIKTLAVRMDRHSQNAGSIAERLSAHPNVERVFYPGLTSHVGHDIARVQMSGFGGMISVAINGGQAAARHVVANTHLFTLAESLGGVESLIEFPFAMTHAAVAGTSLAVPENLIRLSVGIEDIDDLTDDIVAALDSLNTLY